MSPTGAAIAAALLTRKELRSGTEVLGIDIGMEEEVPQGPAPRARAAGGRDACTGAAISLPGLIS